MRRRTTAIVFACVGLALLPTMASAQGDQASIVGLVEDPSGGVMPGVTVEAASPALIRPLRTLIAARCH